MDTVLGEDKPFVLRDASVNCQEKESSLHCLLLHIAMKEELDGATVGEGEPPSTQFCTLLEWLTFVSGK